MWEPISNIIAIRSFHVHKFENTQWSQSWSFQVGPLGNWGMYWFVCKMVSMRTFNKNRQSYTCKINLCENLDFQICNLYGYSKGGQSSLIEWWVSLIMSLNANFNNMFGQGVIHTTTNACSLQQTTPMGDKCFLFQASNDIYLILKKTFIALFSFKWIEIEQDLHLSILEIVTSLHVKCYLIVFFRQEIDMVPRGLWFHVDLRMKWFMVTCAIWVVYGYTGI